MLNVEVGSRVYLPVEYISIGAVLQGRIASEEL